MMFQMNAFQLDLCPKQMSGADFYALAAAAVTSAMQRHIDETESAAAVDNTGEEYLMVDENTQEQQQHWPIVIDNEDFKNALTELRPSAGMQTHGIQDIL